MLSLLSSNSKNAFQESRKMRKLSNLVNQVLITNYSKCRIWIFWILEFSTNFCSIKTDLSGYTVASFRFSKTPHNWRFFGILIQLLSIQNVNVARYARNVERDFLLWKPCIYVRYSPPWVLYDIILLYHRYSSRSHYM